MNNDVRISQLTKENIDDFLKVINERNMVNAAFYKDKLLNDEYYGGFIAYVKDTPIGCLTYIKRYSSLNKHKKPVKWFNDWFVSESARGLKIGIKLMEVLIEEGGSVCGIITPKNSGKIALKSSLTKIANYYEFKYPLSPVKLAWLKYKRNGKFSDNLLKRLTRVAYYILKSKTQDIKPKLHTESFRIENYDNTEIEPLLHDNQVIDFDINYLDFIFKLTKLHNKKLLRVWKLIIDDAHVFGYQELIENNIKQTIVLYISATGITKRQRIIESTLKIFKVSDTVSFLLNEVEINEFGIDKEFFRLLPFYSSGLNVNPDSTIDHIDKESTWTPQ